MVWAYMFTMILKFTGSKKAVGCVLSTFVVLEGEGGGGMMSLHVWSHVLLRGYNVTSCLVPCFFQGISGPRGGCLVHLVLVPGGVLVSWGSGPREGLVKGGYDTTPHICEQTFPQLRWRTVKIVWKRKTIQFLSPRKLTSTFSAKL